MSGTTVFGGGFGGGLFGNIPEKVRTSITVIKTESIKINRGKGFTSKEETSVVSSRISSIYGQESCNHHGNTESSTYIAKHTLTSWDPIVTKKDMEGTRDSFSYSKKSHQLQTKEWRFEEGILSSPVKRRLFDPYHRTTASSACRNRCVADIEERVEAERKRNLMEDFEKIKIEDLENYSNNEEMESEEARKEMPKDSHEKVSEGILENLKDQKVYTNKYLVLLNRLDEEEGVKIPSLEDKLKLAEDHLRISTAEFCKACEDLIEGHTVESSAAIQKLLKPDIVQEALRPKVFDPSPRPPQTLTVTELKPLKDESKEKKKGKSKKEERQIAALKKGFFLPSDTWFSQEKQDEGISPEELELLSSTSTKAFLRFLNERKKEPPKILKEIQTKLQKMQELN